MINDYNLPSQVDLDNYWKSFHPYGFEMTFLAIYQWQDQPWVRLSLPGSEDPDLDQSDSGSTGSSDSDLEEESTRPDSFNHSYSADHLISENLGTCSSTKIHLWSSDLSLRMLVLDLEMIMARLRHTSSERGEDPDQDEMWLEKGSNLLRHVLIQSLFKVSDFDPDQPWEDRNMPKEDRSFFEKRLFLIRIFSSFRRDMSQDPSFLNGTGFFQNQIPGKETKIKSDQKMVPRQGIKLLRRFGTLEERIGFGNKHLGQETNDFGVLSSICEPARPLGSEGLFRKMLGLVLPIKSEGEMERQDLGKIEIGVPELLGFQSPY